MQIEIKEILETCLQSLDDSYMMCLDLDRLNDRLPDDLTLEQKVEHYNYMGRQYDSYKKAILWIEKETGLKSKMHREFLEP